MKGVKFAAGFLLGCLFASSWWVAAVFGWMNSPDSSGVVPSPLWILPALLTCLVTVVCVEWIRCNWKEKDV